MRSEVVDIIADVRIIRCDVRLIRECVERTVREQLNRKGELLGFGLRLSEKYLVKLF